MMSFSYVGMWRMAPKVGRLLVLFLMTVVAGCGAKEYPPVEVMAARFGLFEEKSDGKKRFIESNIIPLREEQGYYWAIYLRTNKTNIRYTEEITLSGPTTWNVRTDQRYEVSSDKRSITMYREKTGDTGIIFGVWKVSVDDPPGNAVLKIRIEDKVQHGFNFVLRKP